MHQVLDLLVDLAAQGGPRPTDDQALDDSLDLLEQLLVQKIRADEILRQVRRILPMTMDTMQGFAYLKPNGYAGCFEIIERLYQRYHCADPRRYNWDRYWQKSAAAQAVRNRKSYFLDLVLGTVDVNRELQVLNVASGPCRDIYELFHANPELPVRVDCVEQDSRAIAYATQLCAPMSSHINFRQGNALRHHYQGSYDLVWSAGLFDYLDDRTFVRLARRLAACVAPGGKLVIGNFSPKNPNRTYMRIVDWDLHHRSPARLLELAERAGFTEDAPWVEAEQNGVNLFLVVPVSSESGLP